MFFKGNLTFERKLKIYNKVWLYIYIYIYIYMYMYIWHHFIHNICWNIKNILYSNCMIIYRLCKVLSFTWRMTLSITIWFWILKTFSQQLHDKLPTWKYISTFFYRKQRYNKTCRNRASMYVYWGNRISYFFTMHRIYQYGTHEFILFYWLRVT